MLENKNNVTEGKNASDSLVNMLYTVEERSLSLRICHWKIPKWKTEEKKKGKKKIMEQNI